MKKKIGGKTINQTKLITSDAVFRSDAKPINEDEIISMFYCPIKFAVGDNSIEVLFFLFLFTTETFLFLY